jgi:hypothetical protein
LRRSRDKKGVARASLLGDAVFRALDVVILPGYARPMVRVEDYLRLIEDCTFGDDVVHPVGNLVDKHPRLRRRLGH